MRLPKNCKLEIKQVDFDGLVRPKTFFAVSLICSEPAVTLSQYVIGHPLLLRVRLWLAVRRCVRMLRKYKSFT